LSTHAEQLYDAIAAQNWELVDTLHTVHPNARHELLAWGLISDEQPPVARDPQHALRTMVSLELEKARRCIELVETMPELSRGLIRSYRQAQLRAGGVSEYLDSPEAVNVRIGDVIAGAKREILAAQPHGPRKREILDLSVTRDSAALDRGVALRTIYRDTVRDHPVTADYARAMATRASGRRAEYRTLHGSFVRMIIVDRVEAFIPDLIVEGSDEHAAWHVKDPAVVAVLAEVFESKWMLCDPWNGELRPRRGRLEQSGGVDTVSGAAGSATSKRQREIMRQLVAGMTRAAVARTIGVSERKLAEEIAVLKEISGAKTAMQLAFWWGQCPDRLIDDSAPAGDGGGPVTTGAAVRAETAA
jgi:DNA-binding CsgD family transcriptional regulator